MTLRNPFFSYQLCANTEMLLSCKGLNFLLPPKRLKFKNYLFPFDLLNHAFLIMIINMSLLCTLKLKCWVVLMLDYHHIEFITERITVMKIYCRKNMTPLSASVKTKTILSRSRQRNTIAILIEQIIHIMENNCHILKKLLKFHSTLDTR